MSLARPVTSLRQLLNDDGLYILPYINHDYLSMRQGTDPHSLSHGGTACTLTCRKIHSTSTQGFQLLTSHLATITSVLKTPKFVWPFTKVDGELNMQETNAAAPVCISLF